MNRRTATAFVAGMGVCGCMWLLMLGRPGQVASAGPAVGGGDVLAFTTENPNGVQHLYLIDTRQQVFSVYEFDTKKSKLKLAAARQYSADHQLQEYNTESPTVSEIEKLVRPR